MTEHTFGGNWTEDKLSRLAKYLAAYRTIFSRNERARHFTTWYVDAFAGTGSRSDRARIAEDQLFEDVYEDGADYRAGSARIALELAEPFDRYLFMDKSRSRVTSLKDFIDSELDVLSERCLFLHGDANALLREWCSQRNWRKERAVVFLDPYGMQVEWATVEALGSTRAVDLWYLFPLGIGVSRLLRHDGRIDESWRRKLGLLFGTEEWQTQFYKQSGTADLFGDTGVMERDASTETIRHFIKQRLETCFEGVADGLILRNSRSSPLYLLCFAASNKKGASTALRIARDILDS